MPEILRHDAVVYGGTPGGIAFAIRAAREGLSVLLVTHTPHLGGMLTSGLCCWDTLHEGRRSPIYDELRMAMFEHYRTTYGEDSEQYRAALPGPSGHNNGNFEARVARLVVERMVAREPSITVRRRSIPVAARREGRALTGVSFRDIDGADGFDATAAVFADCSYEGDLMQVAGAAYRFGREARSEFGEPHAGRIHMRRLDTAPGGADPAPIRYDGGLKLRRFVEDYGVVETPESGRGDDLVQAYNWRTVLTDDPANRLPIPAPTGAFGIDVAKLDLLWLGDWLPNRKIRVNRPQLVGVQNEYVEGDWAARHRVMDAHWNAFLAVVRHLQNDPSLPEKTRERWREFGLAKDEFADNGHRPYEIYVRESRRLRGRHVFSEHDVRPASGIARAPIHGDSIAATDWYVDVHACSYDRIPGAEREGKVIMFGQTVPGQVPFRSILPPDLDNLLVPVCASCTHIGWAALRLEPTWMTIAESAGFIAAIAVRRGVPPASLAPEAYQPTLARSGVMLGFLNDAEPSQAAAQYFATKGYFAGYDARLGDPLSVGIGTIWAEAAAELAVPVYDPMRVSRRIGEAEAPGPSLTADAFRRLLPAAMAEAVPVRHEPVTRGQALAWLFAAIDSPRARAVAAS